MPRLSVLGLILLFFYFYTDCKGQEARYYNPKGKLVNFYLKNQELIYSKFKRDKSPYKLTVNDSNGRPFISVQLKDSLLHGKFRVFSPGRKIIVKGYFTKGKASGKWVFYNPFGKKLYIYNLDTFPDTEFLVVKRMLFNRDGPFRGGIFLKSATQVERKYGRGNGSGRLVYGINIPQKHVNEDQYQKAHHLINLQINEAGVYSSEMIIPYMERIYYSQWNPKLKRRNKVSVFTKDIVHFCYKKDIHSVRYEVWNLDLYIINYYTWGSSNKSNWETQQITDSTYKIVVYNAKGEITSDRSYIKVLRKKCPPIDFSRQNYFIDVHGRISQCHLEEVVFEHGMQRYFNYENKWVEYNMKYGVYDQ